MKFKYKKRISALSKSSDFLKRRIDCYRNMRKFKLELTISKFLRKDRHSIKIETDSNEER